MDDVEKQPAVEPVAEPEVEPIAEILVSDDSEETPIETAPFTSIFKNLDDSGTSASVSVPIETLHVDLPSDMVENSLVERPIDETFWGDEEMAGEHSTPASPEKEDRMEVTGAASSETESDDGLQDPDTMFGGTKWVFLEQRFPTGAYQCFKVVSTSLPRTDGKAPGQPETRHQPIPDFLNLPTD
jgi:hypothetical protein